MENLNRKKVSEISRDLVKDMYVLTKYFPDKEKYELASRIQDASISIPANITKGMGKFINYDILKYLDVANQSSYQLELSLHMAFEQGYFDKKYLNHSLVRISEIQNLLYQLRSQVCMN